MNKRGRPKNNGHKKLKDSLQRVDIDFLKEIENIKDERLTLGLDKNRIPTRILTRLIVKHNSWDLIKSEIIKEDIKIKLKNE